eukprot:GHVU01107380.1.p2 GENE.GHVU01107380.1~~GHVU01107380.1.p2  ORF type:complete len:139 (-),score=22.13 GHVU01107380.1:163-579(-)
MITIVPLLLPPTNRQQQQQHQQQQQQQQQQHNNSTTTAAPSAVCDRPTNLLSPASSTSASSPLMLAAVGAHTLATARETHRFTHSLPPTTLLPHSSPLTLSRSSIHPSILPYQTDNKYAIFYHLSLHGYMLACMCPCA